MDKSKLKIVKKFGDKEIAIRSIVKSDLKQPEKFRDFINSLVKEDAMILINSRKSRRDELQWLKGVLKAARSFKEVRLVAEHNGKIVGNAGIALKQERENHLGELGISIRQGYRGMGLGKFLMNRIIKLAKRQLRGLKIIRLAMYPGNRAAAGLYKKMGFRVVAKIPKQIQYQGKLIDKMIMLKEV